ncbi:uncharacterized protein LOC126775414 isoform X2 [Nymphalis io]|uniref:uncharacterized protein LOC126775414 isoform X2 n=1 Tax=Inachis io TaxID=171585 RepID=UPI00216A0AF4|nr:uncharacterized protein LOC126775414 isoform X2 [Nymphalis io]
METDGSEYVGQSNNCIEESQSAVNNLIIDYYKKFGRKRDLEQFFSLSTAQSDIRDPTSLFWRKMKSQTDSSDSGEKKSESSAELCRISIQCSIPEPSTSQNNYKILKSDSESPPIIRDEAEPVGSRISDNESIRSEDMYSHKFDGTLDTSTNKPHSPTSSITSQRKLEWDSLADVGYGNTSDRKNSASSLSTIERMALHQQYSNNDTKQDSDLGMPTAQSTPLDVNDNKAKNKKGFAKKTTKIYNRDIDSVNLNISQNSENNRQPINVNLTKHISFNVEKDGGVSIENISKSVSVSPEKVSVETEVTPQRTIDKEIQTTLIKNKQKSSSSSDFKEQHAKAIPVLINLNTLKKKTRKKRVMRIKRQQRRKSLVTEKKIAPLEKSTEQLSEAESFEYMPGHIYNQNQMNELNKNSNDYGNKSSLESSAGLTTDSSKTIKYSFTKDLETGIDILKKALEHRHEDSKLKKKLIKEVVQRLIKTKYKDDDSSTEFLSGLSFDSKKIDKHNLTHTTSSTSDANNTATKTKTTKPNKSILRMDKFNANAIASTSQSVPNLPVLSKIDTAITTKKAADLSNTDSDISSKNRKILDTGIDKTSSDILYKKYLDALKREENYKKHLKDKEIFLKQKLVGSDLAFNVVTQAERRKNNLKDLMNDLVRNNYDDGSGDASKLEGGSNSNINYQNYNSIRKQRSHSVFTLSSGNSDNYTKRSNDNKKQQNKVDSAKDCYHRAERHYCCCPYHTSHSRIGVIDSAVQVNIKSNDVCPDTKATQSSPQAYKEVSEPKICQHKCDKCNRPQSKTQIVSDCANEDIKYFCVCTGDEGMQKVPENILIYKCSRLTNKYLNLGENLTSKVSNTASEQFSSNSTSPRLKISTFNSEDCEKKCLIIKDNNSLNNQTSKSSQTNLNLPIKLQSKSSEQSLDSSSSGDKVNIKKLDNVKTMTDPLNERTSKFIHEATRCIQTEISIDPKISDPSLSDINIINDKNCVELISEKYKEVLQSGSKSNIRKQTELRSGTSSAESNAICGKDPSECVCINVREQSTNTLEKYDKEIQSSVEINKNIPVPIGKQSSNNFTIPIQGTNMTLKVSLGSGKDDNSCAQSSLQNDFKTNTKFVCTGTETDKKNIAENYTSIREECSKGVQSFNANIFDEFYQQAKTCCENKNAACENIGTDTQETTHPFPKTCPLNTCLIDCRKYNTFPKNDKRNVQKPLLRSNTDTGKMEKSCHVTFTPINNQVIKDAEVTPNIAPISQMQSKSISTINVEDKMQDISSEKNSLKSIDTKKGKSSSETGVQLKDSVSDTDNDTKSSTSKDPLLDIIQDITRRYSKKDIEKTKRKKCFREIITFLNYLLDTEDNTDHERNKTSSSSACETVCESNDKVLAKDSYKSSPRKTFVDKGIQLSTEKAKIYKTCTNSSDSQIISTEIPSTSSDSATCKILNKIKKECEKYHQKRCKSHGKDKKCEASSSTSMNCDQCRRVHHCSCKVHKCKNHKARKSSEKKKKCVAYNLIIQTSDSVVSEEVACDSNHHKLQNIIVKVPSKRKVGNLPFKEVATKIEKDMPHCSPRSKSYRSRSLPNDSEISSTDEFLRKTNVYTVREYLERNRPDFVDKCSKRQHCLKLINDTRANERSAKRQLLSLQLDRAQALSGLNESELKNFARALGHELRRKKVAPKFISEREMKKHSEKIYKSLPEVVHKKEELKKENMKKTNLLMANIFKKNLQKKTLQGAVNLSNYSTVIKI